VIVVNTVVPIYGRYFIKRGLFEKRETRIINGKSIEGKRIK